MNQTLTYLVDEICAGVEIYFTGRSGSQYNKTAFILCDDYSELISKLYLLSLDKKWSDDNGKGRFKNFHDVLKEVTAAVGKTAVDANTRQRLAALQGAMSNRRTRRNQFFHSTSLLDLSVSPRMCVEAFCELLEYGEILFGDEWRSAVNFSRTLATLEILLKLEKCAFSDPSITPKVDEILRNWPRNKSSSRSKGTHVIEFPEDLHLRLSITYGGKELREKLMALLPQ